MSDLGLIEYLKVSYYHLNMLALELPSLSFQLFQTHWRQLSLARKFVLMGGLVVVLGALAIGSWVARQIEDGVTKNAGTATALYVDSFISPLTKELETSDTLSIGPIRALDEVFKDSPVGNRLISVKIWRPDGTVVYSNNYDLIGEKFEVTDELQFASQGEVVSKFDNLHDEEDAMERKTGLPLLEIYSPIRAPWSGKIIAIAEFYEDGTELREIIGKAKRESWVAVGMVMAAMAGLLMIIVYRGSKTIEFQNDELEHRLNEVSRASETNRILRDRVQKASARVTELNENFLKRTSAELHDGPAQLLGFASLRIGEARKIEDPDKRNEELQAIGDALNSAMTEIRNLCKGLSLPEIDNLSLREVIDRVTRQHAERTGAEVKIDILKESVDVPPPVKICIYRFVQEALNNGWKHAQGFPQTITCVHDEKTGQISVQVSDQGPGFDLAKLGEASGGLGIGGLRERVRSIGGELEIISSPGKGTTLRMDVDLSGNM